MLTRKLPGFDSGSALYRLPRQIAAQLKRIPLPWWQGAVALLLLLLLANSAAQLIWALLPDARSDGSYTSTIDLQPSNTQTTALAGVDINSLTGLNLFGKLGQEVLAVEPVQVSLEDEIDAEETKLALKLTAATPSSVPAASWALIAHSGKQQSYVPGDKLPGGRQVTLERVFRDRVILNNNGRFESLWLYEDKSSSAGAMNNRRTPSANRAANRPRVLQRPVRQGEDPEDAEDEPVTISLPKEMPTVESLAELVRFTPHRKGVQVHPGADRTLFDAVGLKRGDVITSVNGVSMADRTQARSILQQARQWRSASFEILRNGKTINLDVDIDNQ